MFWAKRINPRLFSLAYVGQSSHSELIALPQHLYIRNIINYIEFYAYNLYINIFGYIKIQKIADRIRLVNFVGIFVLPEGLEPSTL